MVRGSIVSRPDFPVKAKVSPPPGDSGLCRGFCVIIVASAPPVITGGEGLFMFATAIIASCICLQLGAVPPASTAGGRYRPGSLIVGRDPRSGSEAARRLGGCGGRLEEICPSLCLARLRLEEGVEMRLACERLRTLPWVSFAGPEGLGRGGFVPDDTYF